jgi:ABC-2 type transport system ATP-binding protein
MLKIKNLYMQYDNQSVLENINLNIVENQMTTLLGKNGSGKSTLLRLIAGAEIPSAGLVLFKEHSISQYDFPFIHDICFVHESMDLIVPFSVKKYVSIIKEKINGWDDALFEKMILEREIDISKNYQEFSRGQKNASNVDDINSFKAKSIATR